VQRVTLHNYADNLLSEFDTRTIKQSYYLVFLYIILFMVGPKYFPSSIIRRPYSDNDTSSRTSSEAIYEGTVMTEAAHAAFRQRNPQTISESNSNEVESQPSLSPKTGSYLRSNSHNNNRKLTWNKLNVALFAGFSLLSAATTVPVTLVPTMALSLVGAESNDSPYYGAETFSSSISNATMLEVYDQRGRTKIWIPFHIRTKSNRISESSAFASRLAIIATFGTALGKFINGTLVDVVGARRLLLFYGLCICCTLLALRYVTTSNGAMVCCAAVEFCASILWPAAVVILGSHYMNETDGRFERGVYVTSIASRCGSLLAVPIPPLLIKWTNITWRGVAGIASITSLLSVVVFYFFLTDSPGKLHDPQNPIKTVPQPMSNSETVRHYHQMPRQSTLYQRAMTFSSSLFYTVQPSVRRILTSRVFWAVATAHSGASLVKGSDRILSTYYRDTSYGVVTESKASAMSVFLSVGMLLGLFIGGEVFAVKVETDEEDQRDYHRREKMSSQLRPKNTIAFLYCLSICMCYCLAFLAMPFFRRLLHLPVLVFILQIIASLGLGAGVAVQYYHIPAIVGSREFGKNRGLYAAYTDGIAALVSSVVWRVVGGAVEEASPQGGGWAYGWAACALLLVFCGTLMVSIIEIYVVVEGKKHSNNDLDLRHSIDLNESMMEDEIKHTGFRQRANLTSSALDYLSPKKSLKKSILLPSVDCRDEDDEIGGRNEVEDLLGIVDDDGSFLIPMSGKYDDVAQVFQSGFHSENVKAYRYEEGVGTEIPSDFEDEISTVFDAYSSMNDVVRSRNRNPDMNFV